MPDISFHKWFTVPWVLAALLLSVEFINPISLASTGQLAFLVSILFFGMPHGSGDIFLPRRLWPNASPRRAWFNLLGIYVIGIALVVLTWNVWPLAGFIFFLILTIYHWGCGDFLRIDQVRAVGRGCLVIGAGFYFGTTETFKLIQETTQHSYSLNLLQAIGLGLGMIALLIELKELRWNIKHRTLPWETLDSLVILSLFAFVPVYWAISLYFMFFHAYRHCLKLQTLTIFDPQNSHTKPESFCFFLTRFHLKTLGITALAVCIVLLLPLTIVGTSPLEQTLGVYFVGLAALTLPHVWIATLLDHKILTVKDA